MTPAGPASSGDRTPAPVRAVERGALRLLAVADAAGNYLYGQKFNPLYQSGTIVVALYLVLVLTGLWLLLFYRVGAPWESVAALTARPWVGNWVRALHRYASDLAVIATAVHAFRMFAQGRSWGPRTLAWVSGGVLLGLILLCGWTGYVMVWDTFGQHLAREAARMLDALPVLSEPTSRAFTGEEPVPTAFFFLMLFAHVAIPLAMGVIFWLHVKRVARPLLLPSRPLLWGMIGLLTAAAVLQPVPMAPEADPLVLPARIPADLFFAFWMPATARLSGGHALLLALGATALVLIGPPLLGLLRAAPPASRVDEDICTGCRQCSLDCPYGAIAMVARQEGRRSLVVARVDPDLCVSCGICAGSCAPMGVGPPGRTGRDQVARVRSFLASPARRPDEVVVICCDHGAGAFVAAVEAAGAVPYRIGCAGSLHTSVIEILLRGGAAGVLILACPPRDCRNREGAGWLDERVHRGREAELQARVDRARVRTEHVNAAERTRALAVIREFSTAVLALGPAATVAETDLMDECEATAAEEVS